MRFLQRTLVPQSCILRRRGGEIWHVREQRTPSSSVPSTCEASRINPSGVYLVWSGFIFLMSSTRRLAEKSECLGVKSKANLTKCHINQGRADVGSHDTLLCGNGNRLKRFSSGLNRAAEKDWASIALTRFERVLQRYGVAFFYRQNKDEEQECESVPQTEIRGVALEESRICKTKVRV